LYWGTHAYTTQQILLRGLPNLDFTIRPSERKLWDPQFWSPFLNVEPTVGKAERIQDSRAMTDGSVDGSAANLNNTPKCEMMRRPPIAIEKNILVTMTQERRRENPIEWGVVCPQTT
jgi:hypothetical protein